MAGRYPEEFAVFHRLAAPLAVALVSALGPVAPAAAQTATPFALDWKFEGPSAPYFVAVDQGLFEAEGLKVEISEGAGSLDAIPKVATGAYPFGFADMSSLMKFLDQNPGAPVTAVMMIYDKPPAAVIGRKSQGVNAPADLMGRKLGAPPPDGAWAQFPIFAAENGLDMTKITVDPVGFPTREPMLAQGQVDAITGFAFTSALNLKRLGVPMDDLSIFLMADHGVALYGNAIIVNTDFAKAHPEQVTGFLTAIAAGWKAAIADPAAAVKSLAKRNPAADAALETERLQMAIKDDVLTPWVKEHGLGSINAARMAKAIEQTKSVYSFKTEPDAALYFDPAYLPDGAKLMLE